MKKKLILSPTCLALCMGIMALSSTPATAQQEMGSLVYYDVTPAEIQAHYNEWSHFLEYNLDREQCQNYVAPPEGYVMKGCQVYRVGTAPIAAATTETIVTEAPKAVAAAPAPAPTTSTYTVQFGFDKSSVPVNEEKVLDNVAQDIQKYEPAAVTVSGYASTPGTSAYNQALSERRAAAVTQELTNRGVKASIIDQKAYGETHLAVPTADNVRMPPNRRVTIEFNH